MKRLIFMLLLIVSLQPLFSQTDTITLLSCLVAANQNAAAVRNFDVVSQISDLKIANVGASWLPTLTAYGKAWYQSDATSVNMGPLGTMEIDRFQYNTGIEANQKIFDGGLAKRSRELEIASLTAETGKIEVDLYQLNSQIADLYFNTLLLAKNREILRLKEELLQKRVSEMETAFNNGIVKGTDLERMNAELLFVQQQIIEIIKSRNQVIAALAVYTGINLTEETNFVEVSPVEIPVKTGRPEYRYFDAEDMRIENLARLQTSKKLPMVSLYGQAGYSYPGLNFFENQSDYYYIVGARFSWTIIDWKQARNESKITLKQKEIIASKRDDFNQKMTAASDKESIEQEHLKELIGIDMDLISRRASVSKGSEAALLNGVITSSAYMEDLNAEIKSRVDLEVHKIQLQRSMMQHILLEGIDLNTTY